MDPSRLVFCIWLAVPGCTAAFQSQPEPSLDANRDLAAAVIAATLDNVVGADGTIPNVSKARRNEIIFARMAEIDILYTDYETRFARQQRESDFAFALLGLGLGSAGAFAGEVASQALSAASGAVTGVQQAYQKEILVERTVQAFISEMRANRAKVRQSILIKLDADMTLYPLQAAISDLELYRHAGTLTAALVGIAEAAALRESAATDQLRLTEAYVLDRRPQTLTPQARSVLGWLNEPGLSAEAGAERNRNARVCFDAATADKPPIFALYLTDARRYPLLEKQLIECLNARFNAGIF